MAWADDGPIELGIGRGGIGAGKHSIYKERTVRARQIEGRPAEGSAAGQHCGDSGSRRLGILAPWDS
jgi:hypothetical protein